MSLCHNKRYVFLATKHSTVFPQSKNREQTVIYYYYNDNFLLKLLKP